MRSLPELKRDNARHSMRGTEKPSVALTINVTQEVAVVLRDLVETGLYGDGKTVESVAEELLRNAVREAREWLVNT